ncbi:carbohydrate ABC transporter permease [Pseudothermotoga sp.]|nr:sugar ABC transporter permease [Pseudothermotoga sp.]MCX7813683.1 sugar ABC transporter permease [Pseudothermotoga sp.]MDW8139470.1 sugar ABC transporter permease [Pseudothermotoga sp.]
MEKRKRTIGYMFMIPSLLILLLVLAFPLVHAFYLSLFNVRFFGGRIITSFVGLENYLAVLRSESWWRSFINTVYFVLADITVGMFLGFISALALNRRLKFKSFIIAAILLPYVLPPIVHALIWKWAFNADYGFINQTLLRFGIIKQNIYWLTDSRLVLWALILANLWQGTAFATIIYLGGMKSIPDELYEAARMDGATRMQQVMYITLPLLKPFTQLLLVMKTILTFKLFELIYAVTGGGPAGRTRVVSYEIYRTAFESYKFGQATAMSYILLGIVAIIVLLYRKFLATEAGEE